jgi:hypothetical protein
MWGKADLAQVQRGRFDYGVVLLVQLDWMSVACSPLLTEGITQSRYQGLAIPTDPPVLPFTSLHHTARLR